MVLALSAALVLTACGGGGEGDARGGGEDLLNSVGLRQAIEAGSAEDGPGARTFDVMLNHDQAAFTIVSPGPLRRQVYSAGELRREPAKAGAGVSLEGLDFPLSVIDPAAVDKIVAGVKDKSGIDGIEVTGLTLARQTPESKLQWTILAAGGGRNGIIYLANADGSGVMAALPAVNAAADCITKAKSPAEIEACTK